MKVIYHVSDPGIIVVGALSQHLLSATFGLTMVGPNVIARHKPILNQVFSHLLLSAWSLVPTNTARAPSSANTVAPLPINPVQVRLSYLIRTWNPFALQTD